MNSDEALDFCQPMILRTASAAPVLRMNSDFAAASGFTEDELAGDSLMGWIHPEDQALLKQILKAGDGQALARHKTKAGGWFPITWRVRVQDGQTAVLGSSNPGLIGSLRRDGDDHSILEQTLTTTLEAMVHVVESKNPGLRCSILLIGADQEHVIVGAGPSLPDEYNQAVEGLRIGPAVGSCGTAAFWNVPVVVERSGELFRVARRGGDRQRCVLLVGTCYGDKQHYVRCNGALRCEASCADKPPNGRTRNVCSYGRPCYRA